MDTKRPYINPNLGGDDGGGDKASQSNCIEQIYILTLS